MENTKIKLGDKVTLRLIGSTFTPEVSTGPYPIFMEHNGKTGIIECNENNLLGVYTFHVNIDDGCGKIKCQESQLEKFIEPEFNVGDKVRLQLKSDCAPTTVSNNGIPMDQDGKICTITETDSISFSGRYVVETASSCNVLSMTWYCHPEQLKLIEDDEVNPHKAHKQQQDELKNHNEQLLCENRELGNKNEVLKNKLLITNRALRNIMTKKEELEYQATTATRELENADRMYCNLENRFEELARDIEIMQDRNDRIISVLKKAQEIAHEEKCETCGGEGEGMDMVCYGDLPVERMLPCPDCDGTGIKPQGDDELVKNARDEK